MTAPDYAALVERLRTTARLYESGYVFAEMIEAASAIERLTQPVGEVDPVCYHSGLGETSFDVLDADKHGWPALYSAATVARLIAERDRYRAANDATLETLAESAKAQLRLIAELTAELAAVRTGDTCGRQCEGTAYRITARTLKAENERLTAELAELRAQEAK